jgi:hypothetical protein
MTAGAAATWGIAALVTGGVIVRPWRLPEAPWREPARASMSICSSPA